MNNSLLSSHCEYGSTETPLPLKPGRTAERERRCERKGELPAPKHPYLFQLPKAGCKAAGVGPVEGTLEVLGGLAVQGLRCSDGSNAGKRICRAREWRQLVYPHCSKPQADFPSPKRCSLKRGKALDAKLRGWEPKQWGELDGLERKAM